MMTQNFLETVRRYVNTVRSTVAVLTVGVFLAACNGGSTTSSISPPGAADPPPATNPPPAAPTSYALTITRAGSGSVISTPTGINCGTNCSFTFNANASVTLNATADGGHVFFGWGGACAGTQACTVTMSQARTVTATFNSIPTPTSHTLTINKTGSGRVSSTPNGIDCGANCSFAFNANTSVTLNATADSGHVFSGWGGVCGGTDACTVSMTQAREVTATFNSNSIVDLNCTSPWAGSEENTTITAWPYRDCFRTDPVAGRRLRLTNNNGGAVAWEQGTGWNGQNALRVRPPDGSLGRLQGYAGLGEHNFHSVRTKRINIRYLFRYNANWARYAQNTKWDIAIKYDYSNPGAPVRREGCERGIVETRGDPLDTNPQDGQNEDFVIKQGVCNQGWTIPNRSGWRMAPGVRENEWISVENEFDLDTGWYRTYITTQDGVYNQSVHTEINIGTNTYGAPAETVPSPYWWGTIDCSTGCFWGWPDDGGSYPRPADTYIWFSHFVMSNGYIGPPAGFVR